MPTSSKLLNILRSVYSELFAAEENSPEQIYPLQNTEEIALDEQGDGYRRSYPRFYLGVSDEAVTTGDYVYTAGRSATGYRVPNALLVRKAVPGNAAKMPAIGRIVFKREDLLVIALMGSEVRGTGFTPGEVYAVGTDGKLAKTGDANYPPVGSVQIVGTAIDDKTIIPAPVGSSGVAYGGNAGAPPVMQSGKATLVAGTINVTGVTIKNAATKIVLGRQGTGAGTLGTELRYNHVGPYPATQFTLQSVDNAGAVVAGDTSTVSYLIID